MSQPRVRAFCIRKTDVTSHSIYQKAPFRALHILGASFQFLSASSDGKPIVPDYTSNECERFTSYSFQLRGTFAKLMKVCSLKYPGHGSLLAFSPSF